jgi:hypothetical protein
VSSQSWLAVVTVLVGCHHSLVVASCRPVRNSEEFYENLRPSFPPGCCHPTPGPGYLEALQEDNIEPIGTVITRVTETGLFDMNVTFREVDAIISATDFH